MGGVCTKGKAILFRCSHYVVISVFSRRPRKILSHPSRPLTLKLPMLDPIVGPIVILNTNNAVWCRFSSPRSRVELVRKAPKRPFMLRSFVVVETELHGKGPHLCRCPGAQPLVR